MRRPYASLVSLLAVPVVALFVLANVGTIAHGACTIFWVWNDVSSATASPSGKYAYSQDTKWTSQFKGTWELRQGVSGIGISNGGCLPASTTVSDGGGTSSGTIKTVCYGEINPNGAGATSSLSAWDQSGSECNESNGVFVDPAPQ